MSTPPGREPYPSEFGAAWDPWQQPLPRSGTGQPQHGQAPAGGEPQYYRQAPGNGQPLYRHAAGNGQPHYRQAPGPRRMARHQSRKQHRPGVIIGVCAATVAVLVALGAGFNAVKSRLGLTSPTPGASPAGSAAPHTLARPASAAGYTRMRGNAGQRLEAEVRQQARRGAAKVSSAWARAFTRAQIGLYRQPGTGSRLIFFGFSARGTPTVASVLRSHAPSAGLDSFFLGAGVANTRDFPAGLLGGVLRCGTTKQGQAPLTMCAWDDSSVLAAVAGAGIPERALARVTLAFRNASEH